MAVSGHGVQIVKVLDNHSYQLDEKLLEQVLLRPEVKDLPVVVVSVAGAYRGGKSFLLNFFIRYLSAPLSDRTDGSWLGADSTPLVGFNWRGGSKRNTTGILLWSEPFINTLPSGEKVAVLLMDTQGNFDSRSTVRDNSTIFALSTLISSVQIYNISMNIQEDDLQHLQLFTTYGKMVQEKDKEGKAFQTLEFLVRDWPHFYEYAYGEEGGRRLLQERLEITPDMAQELKDLRTHIYSSFEKVSCFLMPHPGLKVQNPTFKGNLSEIDQEFKLNMKSLVSSLLSSEKLTPKLMNHQKIKAGELFNYFKAYMKLFNSDEIPTPRNILQATIEAGLLTSMNAARETYEKGMTADLGLKVRHITPTIKVMLDPALAPIDLPDVHEKSLAAAKKVFTDKRTMATDAEINKYINQLSTELAARLPLYEEINMSRVEELVRRASSIYNAIFSFVHMDEPLCIHEADLEQVHQDAVKQVMRHYDRRVKKLTEKPDDKRIQLLQTTESRLVEMKATNDKNNREAIREVHAEYARNIKSYTDSIIYDNDFLTATRAAETRAFDDFYAKRNKNRPSYEYKDSYKILLNQKMLNTYWDYHEIREQRHKEEVQKIIKLWSCSGSD